MAYVLVQSQTNYDYAKFRFPDVKVKGLSGSINLSGNDSSNGFSINETNSKSFRSSISVNYSQFLNNTIQQKTDSWYFSHDFKLQKYTPPGNSDAEIDKNIEFGLRKTQINRKYLNQKASILGLKQKFVEFNHEFKLSFKHRTEKSNNETIKEYEYDFSAIIPAKFGFGRIEPMSDIFLAQFLMDDLLAAGLIGQKFTEDQLFDLAQLLSRIRNQRVFDFRRARVYQLTEIANWLEQNDIHQNIQTFTIINDNWQSAIISQRRHGKRISIGLLPWLTSQKIIDESAYTYYGIGVELSYSNAKPLNQYFQIDFLYTLTHDYQFYREKETQSTIFSFKNQYSFNPNSRTTYSLSPEIRVLIPPGSKVNHLMRILGQANYFINNRSNIDAYLIYTYSPYRNLISYKRSDFMNFDYSTFGTILQYSEFGYTNNYFYLSGSVTLNYALF
jgi:hypothetical protein